jgi:tetratricopeptide (TPR) repeat protein
MWATFDYSWRLLTEDERQVFPRLSMFRGGFTLEAAEAVADWNVATFERFYLQTTLAALVDKSLLRWDGAARYDLHELVRQYAHEKLVECGASEQARERHLAFFLALAEAAKLELHGSEQEAWLTRLDAEHANLQAALAWSQETASGGEIEVRLAAALFSFWYDRGYWSEGRRALEHALARTEVLGRTQARAKALFGIAALARGQGDSTAAYAMLSSSVAIFRNLGDKSGLAAALRDLGYVLWCSSDDQQARALYDESVALFRELGDKSGLGESLGILGILMADQGDLAAARSLGEESLVLYRELDDRQGIAGARGLLGEVARLQGDDKQARALYEEGTAIFRELGNRHGLAGSLGSLGFVLLAQGDYSQAQALFAESLLLRRELGHQAGIVHCLGGLAGVANGVGQPQLL